MPCIQTPSLLIVADVAWKLLIMYALMLTKLYAILQYIHTYPHPVPSVSASFQLLSALIACSLYVYRCLEITIL